VNLVTNYVAVQSGVAAESTGDKERHAGSGRSSPSSSVSGRQDLMMAGQECISSSRSPDETYKVTWVNLWQVSRCANCIFDSCRTLAAKGLKTNLNPLLAHQVKVSGCGLRMVNY